MSILTETLPTYLTIRGKKCPIRTDFKTWLRFSELIENSEDLVEVLPEIFKLIFEELPPNFFDAVQEMIKFYSHSSVEKLGETKEKTYKKHFDFDYDADLIYSAFYQQYHIDLCDADLHWWKFKTMFQGLSEDTHFIEVVQFRSVDLSKIKNKEQRKYYKKMKELHRLPDNRSEEQKELDLNNALAGIF